jgi:hypothetical protein
MRNYFPYSTLLSWLEGWKENLGDKMKGNGFVQLVEEKVKGYFNAGHRVHNPEDTT